MEGIAGAAALGASQCPRWLQSFVASTAAAENKSAVVRGQRVPESALAYQREAIALGVRRRGRLFLTDEMGLGKTCTSLLLMAQYDGEWPLLVLCPKSVLSQWGYEARRWLREAGSLRPGEDNRVQVVKKGADKIKPESLVVVMTYDVFAGNAAKMMKHPLSSTSSWRCVILDEAHKCKGHNTKRTMTIMPVVQAAPRVALLTGTPYVSGAGDLWSQISMSATPEARRSIPSYYDWCERYCEDQVIYTGYGEIVNKVRAKPEMYAELSAVLMAASLRRTKDLVGAQLPRKNRQRLLLDPPDGAKKQVKQLSDNFKHLQQVSERHAGGVPLSPEAEEEDFAEEPRAPTHEVMKLFEELTVLKVPAVTAWMDDAFVEPESPEKVLIFAHHKAVLNKLEEELTERLAKKKFADDQPRSLIRVDGSTSAAQRDRAFAQFARDPRCIFAVLSITACGTGLTLTAASTVVFAELYWSHTAHVQAEDRVHRIGQRNVCDIFYCVLDGSLDDVVYSALLSKIAAEKNIVQPSNVHTGTPPKRQPPTTPTTTRTTTPRTAKKKSPRPPQSQSQDDDDDDNYYQTPTKRRHLATTPGGTREDPVVLDC